MYTHRQTPPRYTIRYRVLSSDYFNELVYYLKEKNNYKRDCGIYSILFCFRFLKKKKKKERHMASDWSPVTEDYGTNM